MFDGIWQVDSRALCDCPSATSCRECKIDNEARAKCTTIVKPHHTCSTHGEYKEYQEHLLNYKNWCIVACTILTIPLCLFCWAVNLNLSWTYLFTGILISSSVVPIALSILWARATSTGVLAGVLGGCLCGICSWLIYASQFPGGLSAATFVKNTGEELPMLVGNVVSIGVGAIASILVSFITRWHMTAEIEEAEWEKTRDIDNPLSPWVQVYKGELNLLDGENFHDRPPLELVISKFRAAKITSYIAGICFTVLFVIIWPGSMLSIDVLDLTGFQVWTTISRGWVFFAAAFIIIVPMYQEVNAILRQIKKNKNDELNQVGTEYQSSGNGRVNGGYSSSSTEQQTTKSSHVF